MQFQSSDFALFYLVVWLIGIVLAITWAVFPFLVLSRLNKLVETQAAINAQLFALRSELVTPSNHTPQAH